MLLASLFLDKSSFSFNRPVSLIPQFTCPISHSCGIWCRCIMDFANLVYSSSLSQIQLVTNIYIFLVLSCLKISFSCVVNKKPNKCSQTNTWIAVSAHGVSNHWHLIICWTVCFGKQQKKISWLCITDPLLGESAGHRGPVMRKVLPCHNVILHWWVTGKTSMNYMEHVWK